MDFVPLCSDSNSDACCGGDPDDAVRLDGLVRQREFSLRCAALTETQMRKICRQAAWSIPTLNASANGAPALPPPRTPTLSNLPPPNGMNARSLDISLDSLNTISTFRYAAPTVDITVEPLSDSE